MPERQLVAVPPVEPGEAFSSWITRLALSQGTSVQVLARHFGIGMGGDIDVQASRPAIAGLLTACGIPGGAFDLSHRLFGNLRKVPQKGGPFLATYRGKPRFRFCPKCLAEQRTPHFPVHWRFVHWRWCPLHDCLLEGSCPQCHDRVVLPVNLLAAGPNKEGVAYLNRCAACAGSLTHTLAVDLSGCAQLSDWERATLRNGRAVLAALYVGHVRLAGNPLVYPVRTLRQLERQGFLPCRFDWLDPDTVRMRPACITALKTGETPACHGELPPRS